ncbi:MAG TPA: MBL fold metallo-hydrolase [Chloroflexota bacterium]|jgi:L-ascorbate metabolism protein UlaG (beta-lactamase superfamily)
MEINWLGHSFFRLRAKEATVAIDPIARKGAGGKVAADVVLISHEHPGHAARDVISGSPRVLTRPGEYEIKGVSIVGVQTAHDGEGGKRRGGNTAWIVQLEDIKLCHLGDIGHTLTEEQAEAIGHVDVLLVPVGGHNTINAVQANEIVTALEPKIVVPMHFGTGEGDESALAPVEVFLREQGLRTVEPQAKLTLTKSALPDDTQVVVLDFRKA